MHLVPGSLALNMREAVRRDYEATPEPKLVVAAGECACTSGIFPDSYAACGPLTDLFPVDVHIPGCPPFPVELIRGIFPALRTRGS